MLNIATNGFPKHGNHALVKACELLGHPVDVQHRNFKQGVPDGSTHHVFIKRDPRNVLVSKLRFDSDPVTPGMFITRFRRFEFASFIEEMRMFEPWLDDPKTFVVSYERLIRDDDEMRRIAEHVGVPYIDGAFENLPGSATWNAIHSNYHDIWTPQVELVWNIEGGPELLKRWGY